MLRCGHNLASPLAKGLAAILLIASSLTAAKPEIRISATTVTPRLFMLTQTAESHWRLRANYSQAFGSFLNIQSHVEFGSENQFLQNPLRVHHLLGRLTFDSHTIRIGRIPHWSGLIQTRIDGGEYVLKTEKFGSLKLLGGFPAVTDFSEPSYAENFFLLASWGKRDPGKKVTVDYWSRKEAEATSSYLGSTWKVILFSRLRVSGSFAWDIGEGKPYYGRIVFAQPAGTHLVRLSIRLKRYVVSNPFSWVDRKIIIPPTVALGITSSLQKRISWWNQFLYRLGDRSAYHIRSSFSFRSLQLTGVAGSQGNRTLAGGGVGCSHKLSSSWSLGGNATVNAVDFGDLIELQTATGFYGWIAWRPSSRVVVRLHGQYGRNPYYVTDGRVGLLVHLVL